MARYNAWQNGWMVEAADGLGAAERDLDRGAFFSSITGTLSHLMWGDLIWMSRFDGGEAPETPIDASGTARAFQVWPKYRNLRAATDHRIEVWTNGLTPEDCTGDFRWRSSLGKEFVHPTAQLFTQFFNHQTHHRGQVHAMLTAAGVETEVTDLPFMPE
ncbi:MAG: damage-inducible protein DinB [Rhodobacteraceae bacterium]|nr:damage-inducible protein DinB [Paracoccaceae bacterium]